MTFDVTLTIRPYPASRIGFSTAFIIRNRPSRLTDMIRRHSSKVISSQGVNGTIAATLASTSTFPWRESASATMRCASSGFEMSASTATPSTPAAVRSAPSPCTSAATTLAPSAASLSATAFPIPCAAPVTIATRSCNFICASFLALVEVRRVLVTAPSVHVVREEDVGLVFRGHLSHSFDRANSCDRVVVEARLDSLLQRLRRIDDVEGEDHGSARIRRDEQRVVPDRVPRRFK